MQRTRKIAGGQEIDPRSIPSALVRFKANPTGPGARDDLILIARSLEGIEDYATKLGSAIMLARELARAIEEAIPSEKAGVVSTIGYAIADCKILTEALMRETDQRSPSKKPDIREVGKSSPINLTQQHINPDDPTVLRAVKAAIKEKGALTIAQIFDIFDYVVTNIDYLNTSHPLEPRPAAVTLEGGVGDCKCMAVVLASMLEAIGAKTILIMTRDQSGMGHEMVGVLISNDPSSDVRNNHMMAMILRIIDRYRENAIRLGNRMAEVIQLPRRNEMYLILDPTLGKDSMPGLANLSGLVEIDDSRPGGYGQIPKL